MQPATGEQMTSMDRLFPLVLAPMEKFWVMDDRPSCPLTFFAQLHFTAPMHQAALAAALRQMVHQHPLLACRLENIGGQPHWVYDPDFAPRLRDPATDPILKPSQHLPDAQPAPRGFDLQSTPGCRYWYQTDPDTGRSCLTVQTHHAVCDGVGMRRALIDAMIAYAERCAGSGGEKAKGEPRRADSSLVARKRRRERLEPKRLAHRDDFSGLTSQPPRVTQGWLTKLANAHYFHCLRPQPLLGKSGKGVDDYDDGGRGDPDDQPLRHHVFDPSISASLIGACRQHKVALEDLMLAILFQACSRWNQRYGARKPNRRIRLLTPVDLRGRQDLRMPATNRLSFAFLGRTQRQCESWSGLLQSVQAETRLIKDTRLYMDILDGIALLAGNPRLLKLALRFSRNTATSSLTYAGDFARRIRNDFPVRDGRAKIGDTFLDQVFIAPPARDNTNITLGVCINRGQICVSANWNRSEITAQQCQRFLGLYAAAADDWLRSLPAE